MFRCNSPSALGVYTMTRLRTLTGYETRRDQTESQTQVRATETNEHAHMGDGCSKHNISHARAVSTRVSGSLHAERAQANLGKLQSDVIDQYF